MADVKDKIVTVDSLKTVYDTLDSSKAPSGYGLGGESLNEVTLSELDSLDGNGWYLVDNNQTGIAVNNVYFNYALLRVSSTNTGWNVIQELFTLTTERVKIVRSRKSNTEWYDWECENPPMVAGREYCTMERYKGKPVYTMLIEFGTLPNAGSVASQTISGMVELISAVGTVTETATNNEYILPNFNYGTGDLMAAITHSSGELVHLKAYANMSGYTGRAIFKYIKEYV